MGSKQQLMLKLENEKIPQTYTETEVIFIFFFFQINKMTSSEPYLADPLRVLKVPIHLLKVRKV